MKKGKYAKKNSFVKTLAVAMVLVTLIGCAIGGTLAWLTAETQQVVNTFTVGNIKIDLKESDSEQDTDNNADTNSYKMIPGWYMDKDPKASVTEGSEDAYLFVKVTESTNAKFSDYMTYEIDDAWTALENVPGVYYMVFNDRSTDENKPVKGTAYSILEGDKVWVKEDVTEAMMESLTTATYPTLTFQAYAVQYWSSNDAPFNPAEAWAKVATPAANS